MEASTLELVALEVEMEVRRQYLTMSITKFLIFLGSYGPPPASAGGVSDGYGVPAAPVVAATPVVDVVSAVALLFFLMTC